MFVVAGTAITRAEVEDFLFAEADLLDGWQLNEWLALFDEERGGFYMPSTDSPDSTHT
jgi:p-cumate 2,3-dioxygenase subunit beta